MLLDRRFAVDDALGILLVLARDAVGPAQDAVQEAAGMAAKMEMVVEMKALSAKKADTDKKSVAMNMKEQASVSAESVNAVVPRTNFNETAFFIPQINTDEEGNIILKQLI